MSTKNKIIQTSIALFNEHSERAISTNHIAAELGISPGNLYYHFKNKEDILRHIFALYRQHLETNFPTLNADEDIVSQLVNYLDSIFELMWQYHFFYDNLADILSRDEVLKVDYLALQDKLLFQAQSVITGLKHSNIIDIDDEDIIDLAHIVKITVSFWTPYVETQRPEGKLVLSDIYTGVLKVLFLFKPYSTVDGRAKIEALQAKYRALIVSSEIKLKLP